MQKPDWSKKIIRLHKNVNKHILVSFIWILYSWFNKFCMTLSDLLNPKPSHQSQTMWFLLKCHFYSYKYNNGCDVLQFSANIQKPLIIQQKYDHFYCEQIFYRRHFDELVCHFCNGSSLHCLTTFNLFLLLQVTSTPSYEFLRRKSISDAWFSNINLIWNHISVLLTISLWFWHRK